MSVERRAELLGHMALSAQLAIAYVEGMSKADFLADKRTQQAVVMNLIIIGESATKLLQDHAPFTEAHSAIPWRSMKGMRNRIAHDYGAVDFKIVWAVTQHDIKPLIIRLNAYFNGRPAI